MLQTKLEHMSKRGKPRWHMPPKPDLASDHMAMLTPLRLAAGIKAGVQLTSAPVRLRLSGRTHREEDPDNHSSPGQILVRRNFSSQSLEKNSHE